MKKLLNNILNWIKTFLFGFRKFYKEHGKEVVEFVGRLKTAVESKDAEAIVNFTKTEADNEMLYKLREALQLIFQDEPIPPNTSTVGLIIFYVHKIKGVAPHMKAAIYLKLASLILSVIPGESITQSDADTLAQLSFKMNKEGKL